MLHFFGTPCTVVTAMPYGADLGSEDVLMLRCCVCLFVMFIVLIALCCIDDVVAIESNCMTLLCSADLKLKKWVPGL